MSALISGLIGAVIAYGLVSLAERTQKSAIVSHDGWKKLRAGWLTNAIIVGSTGFATLIGYFLVSGGSSLPDAATQNGVAALILVCSAGWALYTTWTTYGRVIMWRGDQLKICTFSGKENVRRISDATIVKKCDVTGEYSITFNDGSKMSFSIYLHGADELSKKLVCHVPYN